MQTDAAGTNRGDAKIWFFRVLIVAGAGFMVYSWYAPWWSADLSAIPGSNHLVLRPWGIEAVHRVRQYSENSLYDMPPFFAPLVWTYLAVCMLALATSLFVKKQFSIGRIKLQLASVLIALVGLSYLVTTAIAYAVGEMRADGAGTKFIGRSIVTNPNYSGDITMISQLEIGYWLAIGAGVVLIVLALLRGQFVGKPKG